MKLASHKLWLVVLGTLALTACATPERFTWGTYDASLYAYSKHPDQLPQYEKALSEAIAAGRANGHLAPGLQAELGYCYLSDGKRAEALKQFKAEMASFPESTPFMTHAIAQIQG